MMKKILVILVAVVVIGYVTISAPPRQLEFNGVTLKLHRSYDRNGDEILEYTQNGEARALAKQMVFVAIPRQQSATGSSSANWSHYSDHFSLSETAPSSERFFGISKTLNPEFSQGVYAIRRTSNPGFFVFFREVVETQDAEGLARLRSVADRNFSTLDMIYQRFIP